MGILDPSQSDLDPEKRPRFRQDIAVVVVVAVGVLVYLVTEWLF